MARVPNVRAPVKTFGVARVPGGIDFGMCEGEVVSLVGVSGSSKSTALRCINFLETPTEGHI